jgi:hypothetical protein
LGYDNPTSDEDEDADEDIDGAGVLHQTVELIKQVGNQQDVD